MPPKSKKKAGGGESKKSTQKKKEKMLEDKTFGLKNKKKSKVVQAQIRSIEKSVMNSGDPKERKKMEDRKRAKAEQKVRKKAMEEERNALFGEALLAVKKKTSTTNAKAGAVEAKGRDADEDGKKDKNTSRAMKMMYQMDANEMDAKLREDPNYVPSLEDEIEFQRQAMVQQLKDSGNNGTPVTEETFKAWQDKKKKRKLDAARKLVEAEMKKKKGGKGLSVLTGRALYEYKKDLFKDADDDDIAVAVNDDKKHTAPNEEENGKIQDEETAVKDPPPEEVVKEVKKVAERVQSDLFLEGDDDELDDLDDIDDD